MEPASALLADSGAIEKSISRSPSNAAEITEVRAGKMALLVRAFATKPENLCLVL